MALSLIFSLFANQVDVRIPCLMLDREGRRIGDAVAEALTGLLVCVSRSDQVFQENEAHAIITILNDEFALTDETIEHLLVSAMERETSADEALLSITKVTEMMSEEQKERLYTLVASVAKIDNGICCQEDLILSRLGSMLNISRQREFNLRKAA